MEVEYLQKLVLKLLESDNSIDDSRTIYHPELNRNLSSSDDTLILQSSLQGLKSKEMISYSNVEEFTFSLTQESLDLIQLGSYEYRVWSCLPSDNDSGDNEDKGLNVKEIIDKVGPQTAKLGQTRALKNDWIRKVNNNKFVKNVNEIDNDFTVNQLKEIRETGKLGDEKLLADLKKRKLIKPKKLLHFSIEKGPQYSPELKTFEADLTTEMLQNGSWKSANFKQYNFDAVGVPPQGGALHPLLKVREEFRNIFFEMGFREMPTNQFVESCFWNFDSLFVPQQHVARELQDTFYIKEPKVASIPDEKYYEKVRTVHESGGFGSIGYRAPFSEDETRRLVLRTHTTATSAQCLYEIANNAEGFKPAKLFSIDRVFRNEAVDATHLAEFHQVEGVIADKNITLGDLIGFMEVFFGKMGMSRLRFKPAYNPYTEPSLEIFAYHKGLGKWVEIGNSGMFRPEMLAPMGLPDDVHVLGFGLSLERPTMIKYGINNIRELVGHKVDIEGVEQSEAVRF